MSTNGWREAQQEYLEAREWARQARERSWREYQETWAPFLYARAKELEFETPARRRWLVLRNKLFDLRAGTKSLAYWAFRCLEGELHALKFVWPWYWQKIEKAFGRIVDFCIDWSFWALAIAFFGIAIFLTSFAGLGLISARFNLGISLTVGESVGGLLGLAVSFLVARRMRGRYEALGIWVISSALGAAIFGSAATITHKFGLWPKTNADIFNAMLIGVGVTAATGLVMLWWHRPPRPMKAGVLGLNRFFERSHIAGSFVGFVLFRIGLGIACAYGLYWAITSTNVLIAIPGEARPGGGMPENPALAIAIAIYDILVVDNPRVVRVVIGMTSAILLFYALKDLWSLLVALLDRKRPLESEKAHGKAGKATAAEAKAAARGSTAKPPWADHGYSD